MGYFPFELEPYRHIVLIVIVILLSLVSLKYTNEFKKTTVLTILYI